MDLGIAKSVNKELQYISESIFLHIPTSNTVQAVQNQAVEPWSINRRVGAMMHRPSYPT